MSENVVNVDFSSNKLNKVRINKKQIFKEMLDYGTVTVMLDATSKKSQLPAFLMDKTDVRLNISYEFNIPDFGYDDKGTWATLSFDNDGHVFCFLDWDCVYAMFCYDGDHFMVWRCSLPKDISKDLLEELNFIESISKKEIESAAKVISIDFSSLRND